MPTADNRVDGLKTHKTVESSHGRNERREYYVAPAPPELKTRKEWKDVRTIGMVYRCREQNGKPQEEVVYFITSSAACRHA